MRNFCSLLAILIALCILPVHAAQPCAPTRIMLVGDSITVGTGTDPKVGFRLPLYRRLLLAGYQVDFVGSQGMLDGSPMPAYFDADHEGHGGWRTEEIADHVYEWLEANPADIVLLLIGTNNIGRGDDPAVTIIDYARLLDEVDRFSPATWVIVAQIPNRAEYSPATTEFNLMLGSMVRQRIAVGDRLRLVDMENALLYPDDIYDHVHPAASGYHKMARVWYEAVVPLLGECAGTIPPAAMDSAYLPVVRK
jgi:hypothetical protein